MNGAKRLAWRALRRTLGRDSAVERLLRRSYRAVARRAYEGRDTRAEHLLKGWYLTLKGGRRRSFSAENFALVWSDTFGSPERVGIYAKGSCDLPAIFATAPRLRDVVDGSCAIVLEKGGVASAPSAVLLQALRPQPSQMVEHLMKELALPAGYFKPTVFEPSFRVPGYGYLGEFPKSVVVLSIAADVVRTLYRHREHGLLVDPGGWWLNQDIANVLADLDRVAWFRSTFEKVGKISVEDFYRNYSEVIRALKDRTNAHILVLNVLEVEPGDPTHTYQLVGNPGTKRRRQFNLALIELSRELDFGIVDVDRILKQQGVATQVDFAHFPVEGFRPLGDEIFRTLQELKVFSSTMKQLNDESPDVCPA